MGTWLQLQNAHHDGPAVRAAINFVVIQLGIGIIFKHVQFTEGRHAFSQSSALAISESIKFCLSTLLVYRQWSHSSMNHPTEHVSYQSRSKCYDTECEAQSNMTAIRVDSPISWISSTARDSLVDLVQPKLPTAKPNTFIASILRDLSSREAYGMAYLALLYAIMNNTVFLLYRLAHPSTISLVHAGMTIFTALSLLMTSRRIIAKRQWFAILLQIGCCLFAHHRPGNKSLYPLSTYALLIFQSGVSAVAGLYGRYLLNATTGSSDVCKMALYGSGTIINLTVHAATRFTTATEPGLFHGFQSWDAVSVVASNILIGLALTTAYKYSQAVAQNTDLAILTGTLLYIGAFLFHLPLSFILLPGTVTVFAGTWLHVGTTQSDISGFSGLQMSRPRTVYSARFWPLCSLRRLFPSGGLGLGLASAITVTMIVWLDQSSID